MMHLLKSLSMLMCLLNPLHILAHIRILAPGQKLDQRNSISYPDFDCELIMQQDGNLLTKKGGEKAWSSEGLVPGTEDNEFFAKMLKTGRLVVKSKGIEGKPFFSSKTNQITLNEEEGGLYFENDCSIKIARDHSTDFVWANIRTKLMCGNRLEKGQMFKYPENNPVYTLSLQHDGNLVIFRGADRSDFDGRHDIIYSAHSFSEQDDFYLEITHDGYLVLKEEVEDSNQYEEFWSLRLVDPEENSGGYSLTLTEDGFGYELENSCAAEDFTA